MDQATARGLGGGVDGEAATAVQVRVFHNNSHGRDARVLGFRPEHSVTEVLAFTQAIGAGVVGAELARKVYERIGLGQVDSEDTAALTYFRRGNRALCNGDVVAVVADGVTRYYAVGEKVREIEPPRMDPVRAFGTTCIHDEVAMGSRRQDAKGTEGLAIL
jgi:hypothetical protein